MKNIHISGFSTCGAYKGAVEALRGLQRIFPDKFSVTVSEYETRSEYMDWLPTFRASLGAEEHKTSPIVWFETEQGNRYLGGRDDTLAWCRKVFTVTEEPPPPAQGLVDTVDPSETYDFDLVVVGGGSGGLACSKEAQKLGARVAVLDFVKPSPAGSTWGLGGTCVNVGCIPKKLMHIAAGLGEAAHSAPGYGWKTAAPSTSDWSTLRDNVRDYIKGLNFGYRVQLREAGVTYMNALGRFTGPHSMDVTDAKGKVKSITAARFVLATGGRPTALEVPGGEHAVSSDDIFTLPQAPGRTCVVGAGYVALECAGFIAGLGGEAKVLVRSTPLRSFDQDTVRAVLDYMTKKSGVTVVQGDGRGPLLKSIERMPSGKLRVCYQDTCEDFDTVLAAVGRSPDLKGLNLAALGAEVLLDGAGKLRCTNEQTSVPHVYAIGDIVAGAPELTPVAILAGKLLARRLFGGHLLGGAAATMRYTDIATAVFTPLEMGTVGLSEEQAVAEHGADKVESYISSFSPLEWALSEQHHDVSAFAKVVVLKDSDQVIGMHIAAPGAGEIIQGYGLAMTQAGGLTYAQLLRTVGIHPTVGEEFTTISVAKSSGASAAKAGC